MEFQTTLDHQSMARPTYDSLTRAARRANVSTRPTWSRNLNEPTEENEAELDEQLLPGIPNEITLDIIVPRLHWLTFHVLSSVSTLWRHAIQSRQVYNARVRSNSAQSLEHFKRFAVYPQTQHLIGIRSKGDERSSRLLPKLPQFGEGFFPPFRCEIIALEGKIYVLGGQNNPTRSRFVGSGRVFVFDLAGQRPWKECASMLEPRLFLFDFEKSRCHVKDGKIYVSGGALCVSYETRDQILDHKCGCEVYDPTSDTWSSTEPDMITSMCPTRPPLAI